MPGGRPRKLTPKWPPVPKRPYGSGSLSRNQTTGAIRARLPLGLDPKRTSREFGPDELAAATRWLDDEIARLVRGDQFTPATTWGTWSGHWYETAVEPVKPPNTAHLYLYALQQLAPEFGTRLDALRAAALQSVVAALSQRVGADTLHNVVGVWRRCLDAAVDDELLARNPARRLVLPKRPRRRATRILPVAAIDTLKAGIGGERFEAAFALVLGCGLRIGNVLGLKWLNVDFDGRRIWVAEQYTNGHWRPLPKGGEGYWVYLPDFTLAALQRHREAQPPGCTLVMQSPYRGKRSKLQAGPVPWSRNTVAADFTRLLVRLGLTHATPHAGRHGLASYWLDHGVAPTVIGDKLGHVSGSATVWLYTHASPAGHAAADALTDELLGVSEAESG